MSIGSRQLPDDFELSSAGRASSVAGVVRAALNLLLILLLVLLALSSYRNFRITHSLLSFGILAVNSLFLGLFVTRPAAKAETSSLSVWLLAAAAVALPLLLRPSADAVHSGTGYALQILGLVMLLGALGSLRRSFAFVPGNRGIRVGGLYRIVRHPMYLSEMIVLLGLVVTNPTIANLVIWTCELALQSARILAEEGFLSTDPIYRSYRRRVRYRLIPGLI